MSQDGVSKLVLLPGGEGLKVRGCAGGGIKCVAARRVRGGMCLLLSKMLSSAVEIPLEKDSVSFHWIPLLC